MSNEQFQVFSPGEVALPKVSRSGAPSGPRGSKYPIDENFAIGSAFLVPARDGATKQDISKQAKSLQSSLNRLAKQYKYKLAVRALTAEKSPWADEKGNGIPGVGVWRVEGVYEYKSRGERGTLKKAA